MALSIMSNCGEWVNRDSVIAGLCQCGFLTNPTISNWWDSRDEMDDWKPKEYGVPTYCYVRWRDGKREKGCAYDRASQFNKAFADHVLKQEER